MYYTEKFLKPQVAPEHMSPFMITIDTTKAGTSNSNSYHFYSVGPCDYTIDWGDGSSDSLIWEQLYSNPGILHSYATPGIYQLKVTGDINSLRLDQKDPLKLLSIDNWGDIMWGTMYFAFGGCSNMIGLYQDIPNLLQAESMVGMFQNCSKFNSPVPFYLPNGNQLGDMFWGATLFNQPLPFDTSNVQYINNMFIDCPNFKQSFAGWSISNVVNAGGFLWGDCDINLPGTTTNYDETLASWSNQTRMPNVGISFANSKYSAAGLVYKNKIIRESNWTFTDGGLFTP